MPFNAQVARLILPAAARLQRYLTADDLHLRDAAMSARPGVHWWWGVRRSGLDNYAHCYLCDAHVAHWSGRNPMTNQAMTRLMEHRTAHLENGWRLG